MDYNANFKIAFSLVYTHWVWRSWNKSWNMHVVYKIWKLRKCVYKMIIIRIQAEPKQEIKMEWYLLITSQLVNNLNWGEIQNISVWITKNNPKRLLFQSGLKTVFTTSTILWKIMLNYLFSINSNFFFCLILYLINTTFNSYWKEMSSFFPMLLKKYKNSFSFCLHHFYFMSLTKSCVSQSAYFGSVSWTDIYLFEQLYSQ